MNMKFDVICASKAHKADAATLKHRWVFGSYVGELAIYREIMQPNGVVTYDNGHNYGGLPVRPTQLSVALEAFGELVTHFEERFNGYLEEWNRGQPMPQAEALSDDDQN